MMKERFAKLLLGEDMRGGANGVSTALAISNAIADLSASVFGELQKLEPLSPKRKSIWYQEMGLILCVGDSIIEFVPSTQDIPGGGTFEVMVTRPRSDLLVNLPALKKLDAMLLSILDEFCDSEFYYVDHIELVASTIHQAKWWLPFPKVPRNGLSEHTRKRLHHFKECSNQILKAAMAINSSVLTEMEIPDAYLESLPKKSNMSSAEAFFISKEGKNNRAEDISIWWRLVYDEISWLSSLNDEIALLSSLNDAIESVKFNRLLDVLQSSYLSGKACLGENLHHYITSHDFSPNTLPNHSDLSSENTILEIANKIEAAGHVWRKKQLKVHEKSSWNMIKVSDNELEKGEVLARRADTLLYNLKLQFPALMQTNLDMNKLQHNKDIGHAILEGYSRAIESLAFNIMARINDLLRVDDATRQAAATELASLFDQERLRGRLTKEKRMSTGIFRLRRSLSDIHSSHREIKILNGRKCSFAKKSNLRHLPNQTLQKLNF